MNKREQQRPVGRVTRTTYGNPTSQQIGTKKYHALGWAKSLFRMRLTNAIGVANRLKAHDSLTFILGITNRQAVPLQVRAVPAQRREERTIHVAAALNPPVNF